MIPSHEMIRRLERELHRFRNEQTQIGQGFYQGLKLAKNMVMALEVETKKHLTNNPKAVASLIGQIHRVLWSDHKRYTRKAA